MWLMLLGAALAQQRIVYTGVNVRPVVDEEMPVVRIGFAGSIARNAMDREVLNGVKLGMEDARQFRLPEGRGAGNGVVESLPRAGYRFASHGKRKCPVDPDVRSGQLG